MRDSDWSYWLLQTVAPFLFIFLWSSAYIAVCASLPDVSPLFFLTIRFGLATAVLLSAWHWRLLAPESPALEVR